LEDEYNGRIALSESGSGLKTIMLVLINLILIPELKGIDRKNIIYIFEELENNLHPALQRNLFKYISRKCLQEESKVIFTTHSHVPINMFAGKEEASITHIINRNNQIEVKEVLDYIECNDILKDLDVKASDLLQSNGIVWVEGPSDRVYLNKWIDMFSNGELKEGQHYQILFYGGRLLSHLSAKDEDKEKSESSKLIQLLLTNRNSAIVIDSDKREENAQVNSTKLRIKEEFENYKSFVWITEGKEIENYIPEEILREKYSIDGQDKFEQYDIIQTFLNQKKRTETVNLGDWFVGHKVSFANEILDLMTYENLKDVLDLETKINELITYIKSWN